MADGEAVSGVAVGSVAFGALLVYAGLKGYSIPQTLQDVVTGKSPLAQVQLHPVGTPTATGTSATAPAPAGGGGSSSIVAAALKYDGTHNYSFGGPPPAGTVDCSSWVTDVVGHDCGLPVPGGTWAEATSNGTVHGPNTISYLAWTGAVTVGHSASVAQPGDLCVWQTHMGICIGAGQMISAQDPALGTGKGPISMPGELLFVRRIGTGGGVTLA